MISVKIVGDQLIIEGTFDMGYIGIYQNAQIGIVDELDDVKQWSVVTNNIGTDDCSEKTLEVFLTNYFNEFENKIHANVKQVNDNFLLRAVTDMESCGNEFWSCEELVVKDKMPENPEEEVYQPNWNMMSELQEKYYQSPNNGSEKKEDIESILRTGYPMFNFDVFIRNIKPESLTFMDGQIAFQCSDGFGKIILCCAYDVLDEKLTFTDWHNF